MNKNSRSNWFLPLRLIQYIIITAVVIFWLKFPVSLRFYFTVYSIITLLFTAFIALDKRETIRNATSLVIGLQFALELVLIAGILLVSGMINSSLAVLFIMTIISSALIYRLIGSLITASVISTMYAFITWLSLGGENSTEISLPTVKSILSVDDSLFYSIFLYVLIFYLVAFISGYLSERIRDRERQLADTSRALKKARLETDDILRHLNSGLLTIDALGKIIFFNKSAERILGYLEADVKGLHCEDAFSDRMPLLSEALMAGIRYNVDIPRKELSIRDSDNKIIPLGISTSILTEDNKEMRGIIAIFTDLSEAKELEAKVRSADRLSAVGELSASIAHEIRNPLAAISGSVQVLSSEIIVEGDNQKLMNLIVSESDRLTNMLNEFLAYARIDRPVFNKVDLGKLINEVIDIVSHHQSWHVNIKFNFNPASQPLYVIGDEGMIKQLLINLAVNSCEALGLDGGEIGFELLPSLVDRSITLKIKDTGPGISKDDINNIYKPFYSTKKEGTGLGLSIVQRICNAMKLPITAESKEGKGTSFKIRFPGILSQESADQADSRRQLTV